ncbi:up-regulator of cell proliferation-like [Polymixia lowei]
MVGTEGLEERLACEADPNAEEGLLSFLSKLGLEKFYPNKLTLQSLLEINKDNISDKDVESVEDIPCCFLRKLFEINAECRTCIHISSNDDTDDDSLDVDLYTDEFTEDNEVNPLDLITALFLCADSFLQQEMSLKMSMCQFSVPLILPFGSQNQGSLMLWALRDILKEWRPHDMSDSKGFVESNIVCANIPLFSFVRLKNCGLSKSQLLNYVLCSGQQTHNIFIHRDIEGGTVPRRIANGLVEVCWYLPCGTANLDIFPEPIAFANLRGDVSETLDHFSFLFQVSTATFVFLDKVEETEHRILTSLEDVRSKLFFVVNRKEGDPHENIISVKKTTEALELPQSHVKTKDPRVNVAKFSKKLVAAIKSTLTDKPATVTIEAMFGKAVELGLSVDECHSDPQKTAADEIMKGIGVRSIPDYKKQQLPLQGNNWKKLAQLEKEECRLQQAGGVELEEYKSQLQADKLSIRKERSKYKLSKAMQSFIASLTTTEKEKRDFFLKWMKLKLDANSRSKLSELRNKFKEECKKNTNKELISELDQNLLNSSLGIEHYIREMGQIYEVLLSNTTKPDERICNLPGIAAEMLLDGHPLELLDGDASNIPERWVTDVLMELHRKVGEKSRLKVLTVLGVQSTGKSTLLNTMFGVQFPVSSGRCTRGAFMLFLRIGEDMQRDLNCDFILLIDTEGLKSSDLAQQDDSYEHDNQLATLVIGLSDVTIINIAMENSTEMKDVLQIAAHAFLRMKEVGKKPVCHFVHQNVAGVSAHTKNMTERQHLLEQLNEMTQIAAEMERQPSIQAFTDVMDYDVEKNNWYIPGLWHGTPPMAPVNTGYSEAVADLKKNLLEILKSDKNIVTEIPEFLEWMRSLWKAVKYENFIFSFRNTLVAHAYDSLCKEFSEWEWTFRKDVLSWQTAAELEISNAEHESDIQLWNNLVASKKSEASKEIRNQTTKIRQKLHDYYKSKNKHVNLIEKYKVDFVKSIDSLEKEITHSVNNKLDCVLEFIINSKKAQDIQRRYRDVIEDKVMKLLSSCKDATLSDEELTDVFEEMWSGTLVGISGLKERDISACILQQLRKNVIHQKVNEELQDVHLHDIGKDSFKAKTKHIDSYMKNIGNLLLIRTIKGDLQSFADRVIETCTQFVVDTAKTNRDYNDTFTKDLLIKIDENLQQSFKRLKTNNQFEIDLKLHICGIACREFLQMHRKFLLKNDPKTHLEKYRTQYLSDFLDLYKERDHCQRKATDFVQCCIRPAFEDYVNRSLGINIVDEILTSAHSPEYSSRSFFQYCILKELLQKDDFKSYLKYICNYEIYVKDWIVQHIHQNMSEQKTLCKLKINNLEVILHKTTDVIKQASTGEDGLLLPDNNESITVFINNLRSYLVKDISISMEAVKRALFQIRSTCHPFTKSLTESLNDLRDQLQEEFSNFEDIDETLNNLPIKPQDELFKRVFGCGQQCPFCKVPCEAGGKDHRQHHAAVHRPKGLGTYRNEYGQKLNVTLCTTDVQSDKVFRNIKTNYKFHPYKKYHTYYPDWNIPPDRSIESSDYWKYVLVQYNDGFAQEYKCKPADIPEGWRRITKEQALKGLKDAFNVKGQM